VALCHHHAHFDAFIESHHFDIHPGLILDTLSLARALHGNTIGNSLEKLALHYKVGQKGKEVQLAIGKRRKDFTKEEFAAYGAYCNLDVDLDRAIFWKMAEEVQEVEHVLIDMTVKFFSEPVLEADVPLLRDSLEAEKQRKADLLARVAKDSTALTSNPQFAALLMDMGVTPPTKVSPRTGKETFAFAKNDPGFRELLENGAEEVRWLCEARVGVRSTIIESRTQRILDIAERGPIPLYLKFAGAKTWRWSGSDRINPQNFNRGGVIRNALLAPEGHVLVVVDSAQIEARVLAWLAEHHELVAAFAQKRDVYSEFASAVYRRKVDRKRTLPDGTKPDEVPGFVGKVGVLGLGYGLGWLKLAQTFLAGAMGGPPVRFGDADAHAMRVDVASFANDPGHVKRLKSVPTRLKPREMIVHSAVCKALVDGYREVNAPVPALWNTADVAIQAMCEGGGFNFGPGGCLRTVHEGVVLPSGRVMRYPELEVDDDGFIYRGGRGKGDKAYAHLYGGHFVENLCQAIARDIVAFQLLRVRAEGYRPVSMTHDEGLFLAPEAEGPRCLDLALKAFKTPPSWALDLPLSAEGGFNRSYGRAKS
jgi:DNA polymerase